MSARPHPIGRLFGSAAAGVALLSGCGQPPRPSAVVAALPVACAMVEGETDEDAFGCANSMNLELMVANPADLETPAALGDARGDAAFDAARRHRMGQVKPLPGDGGYSSAEASPEAEPQ